MAVSKKKVVAVKLPIKDLEKFHWIRDTLKEKAGFTLNLSDLMAESLIKYNKFLEPLAKKYEKGDKKALASSYFEFIARLFNALSKDMANIESSFENNNNKEENDK